ncbi:uncharacterized protein [Drosophila tropicalis]|uniref:uncharacterized protein n=1 Tax=Drosophila tropicalis TaxID=46794 RepID=UPI0035AB6E66
MQNIKNLKDPTRWICSLGILSLLVLIGQVKPAELAKVICRDHDTTITCDCNNVGEQNWVLPQLKGAVDRIEVRNCPDLIVETNTLTYTEGLRKIRFQHIGQLVLHEYGLSVSRYASNKALIVEFEDVNFHLIDSHAINGNIDEISFVGGSIEKIQPFGFTTIKERAILLKLEGVTIQRIESQAFKKFSVEQMIIANCHFTGNLPTRAFYEVEVLNELSIRNNQFLEVHSHAFALKFISKLSLSENRFVSVDGEWLEALIRDAITMRSNNFGITSDIAFRSLRVHRDYKLSERLELRFHNNTVRSWLPTSSVIAVDGLNKDQENAVVIASPLPLHFDDQFSLSLREVRYDNAWNCDQLDRSVEPPLPRANFFRQYSEQLLFQRQAPERSGTVVNEFVPLRQIIAEQCQVSSYVAYIVVGSVLLSLLLVAILLLLWWRLAQRRKRRKLDVVQPEPRTYKETQIVYQIENAGLLKTDM